MLCERCKKREATISYKENINGHKSSISLCSECAAELGGFDTAKKLMADPFDNMNSLFNSLLGISPYSKKSLAEEKKCNLCGATFRELVADGKLGCPKCYSEFSDELSATIARIHGSARHTGSAPQEYMEDREKKLRIDSLEKELKEAVSSEEYEKAAALRDKLRELKNEKGGAK